MADDKTRASAGASPPSSAQVLPPDRITRREALRSGMFATVGMFFGVQAGGAGVMLWPIKLVGFGGLVPVPKKLDEIKVGDPPLTVRDGKFYLTRVEEGLMALYWKCPHLGCTVPWNTGENLFHCPCHSSIYNLAGQNVSGPTPRPLDMMEIQVNGQDIVVDTGKITQRAVHEPGHATQV